MTLRQKNWRQIEISFTLSSDAHTQPKFTSTHKKCFPCGTFSYKHGSMNEKHVQRGSRPKKSRCLWDRVYLRTSMATSGEPSTWFPLA